MSAYVSKTFRVPAEIPRGLGVDQSQALLDWIVTVPNGPGIMRGLDGAPVLDSTGEIMRGVNRIVFDGEFHVDARFRLIGRIDLMLDFGETGKFTRVNRQEQVPHFVLNHCSFCYLDHFRLQGTKPKGMRWQAQREAEHGIRFEGSQGIRVRWPEIDDVWGDHFYFGKTNLDSTLTTRCEVTDAVCGESGRHSISMTAAKECQVLRSTFGNGRTCIDFEPNGARGGVWDARVDGCTFAGIYTGLFCASASPSTEGVVEGVTVVDCKVPNGSLQTVIEGGARRASFAFDGNEGVRAVGKNNGAVLYFRGVDGVTVKGNRNPVQLGRVTGLPMRVARFVDCTDVVYADNWPADTV